MQAFLTFVAANTRKDFHQLLGEPSVVIID